MLDWLRQVPPIARRKTDGRYSQLDFPPPLAHSFHLQRNLLPASHYFYSLFDVVLAVDLTICMLSSQHPHFVVPISA